MVVRYSRTRDEWAVYSDDARVFIGSYQQCEEYLDFHEYLATSTPPTQQNTVKDKNKQSSRNWWPLKIRD
jgi:hypothetical protein